MSKNTLRKNDWVTVIDFDVNKWGNLASNGYPQQVQIIDWPFAILANLDGTFISVDTRTLTLKKMSLDYVRVFLDAAESKLHRYLPMTEEASKGVRSRYAIYMEPDTKEQAISTYEGVGIEPPTCPRCRSLMVMFEDTDFEGIAFYCEDCEFIQDRGEE